MLELTESVIDERLFELEREVRGGRPYDNALRLFRLTYFPPLDDTEALKLAEGWAKRKMLRIALAAREVDVAGRAAVLPCLIIHV